MGEEEKIMEGILFCPGDPELKRMKLRSHNLCTEYNRTYEDETEKRQELIRQIVGEIGEEGFMQGPIFFHYGCHTKIGTHFFGNYNLTVQDDASVTIGDYCNFGPNVTIVTPVHPMLPGERNAMLDKDGNVKRLCYAKPVKIGQQLLVWRQRRSVLRRHHRRRLCDRSGQRGCKRHPASHLCGGDVHARLSAS